MFSFFFSNPPSRPANYNSAALITAPKVDVKQEPAAPVVPETPKVNTTFNSWFGVSIGYSSSGSLFGKPSTPPPAPAPTTVPIINRVATPSTIATNSHVTITKKGLFNW